MRHSMPEVDEITGRHLDWRLFKRFLVSVWPYRRMAWASLLLLPLTAAAKLVQPWLLMVAIDRYILPGDLAGLPGLAALFLFALTVESGLLFIQGYLVQAVGQRIMADLRRDGFRRLLRLPVAFFDRHPSGRLVTRLTSDVENVGELFGAGVIAALGDIVTLIGIVAVMLWLDVSLSLVAFAVLPLLLLTGLLFRRYMRQSMRQVRARLAGLNGFVAERLAGMTEVRLFGQERRTLEEFEELQQAYCQSTVRVIDWDATLFAVVEALGAVAIAGILWRGGGEVVSGVASFGLLVAFIEYVQKFFAPLRDLSSKYSVIQASNASLERIYDLLDQPPEPQGSGRACTAGAASVRFEGVDFTYDGKTPVLQGIDLAIDAGETVALVGATGSGKTTLARLLLGFYPLTAGRIRLDGTDLAALDLSEVRRRVGWVSQEPFLFAGTVRENIDPEGRLGEERLLAMLTEVGALAAVERLGGLQAVLSERGKNLSAGERQLLCLARALVPQPGLLILDEATSRLDLLTEEFVNRGLTAAGRSRSVLLIAHRLQSARRADRIVVLRRGKIRECGTHEDLLQQGGLYARLWALQDLGVNGEGV
jgi:ATP-binding cassette, subfamily B, multidrug efflux pump